MAEDKSIGFPDDEPNVIIGESPAGEEAPIVTTRRKPWYQQRWPLVGIGLATAVAVGIAALVFTSGRSDRANQTDASVALAAPGPTIKQYIDDDGITSTPMRRGDPGAPNVVIALPPGWSDMGEETPEWAFGAVELTGPLDPFQMNSPVDANDPPTIVVLLSELSGDADPTKILEYAPNELKSLPNYQALTTDVDSKLGGFDAIQLAGLYTRDGEQRSIAQKTVVIPVNDAVYVLQINAEAPESNIKALMDATDVIDKQTTITP